MSDSIRIDTGVKRIVINYGPEVIEFCPSDVVFAEKFYRLIQDFETKQAGFQARAKAIDDNSEVDANGAPVTAADGIALMRELCEWMRERIDNLFGAGTSQKCFGDALNLNMFMQFFQGITPFIQSARSAKVAQYQKQSHKKPVMR